jgi:hypothetical protein
MEIVERKPRGRMTLLPRTNFQERIFRMVCCPRSESIRLAADLRSANSVFATQGNTHRPALALNGSFAVVVSGRIDYGCAS